MSLLTPPHTSHRSEKEKENKFPDPPVAGPSTRTVAWATKDVIHSLATPIKHVSISSKHRPSTSKSILKSLPENYLLELPPVSKKRETTPEPADPLVDLHYLDHPVDQILLNGEDSEEALGKLIEGYNVLTARLRSSITEKTDADASWPIFQPLRKNREAFVDAVVRDVKRALVDPMSHNVSATEEVASKLASYALPSPANSPTKKKGGLSEEQVKYARDLGTTCHSVIKLLAVMLCLPAIYNVFEEKQLSAIVTSILSIPLADDLPTPNARKTCALAIWLIQVQRLPATVLKPAASRIAYAIRRGLDGELGKEGKKGSANDGMKAIHDLCVYLPAIFVPAFTPLLPSLLANLLAPTLALRTQACHALGGFAIASTAIPLSTVHTNIASTVSAFLTTATPSPNKTAKSSAKPVDAAIVRTLRTTMNNNDPVHVASGPVWSISVCASLVVLLGARLSTDPKVTRILDTLLNGGLCHERNLVRGLTCTVWRSIAWAYFQPALPLEDDEESEVDEESYMQQKQSRLAHCKVMMSVVDYQAGVSTIAALLGDESAVGDEPLQMSLNILQLMTLKAGNTCRDAIEALQQMVSGAENAEPWNIKLLLPPKLFSANPGLLTADFKNLSKPVREVFDQLAMVNDIRSLTKEEMTKDWVLRGVMVAWRTALGCLEMEDSAELPSNLTEIWSNLLKANVNILQENGDDDATSSFACSAIKYITHVIEDPKLNLLPRKPTDKPSTTSSEVVPDSDDTIPEFKGSNTCTNGELRMRVVHRMWSTICDVFPANTLRECAESLLANLMKNENMLIRGTGTTTLVADDEGIEQARTAWVALCVDVLLLCDADAMKMFWACEEDMAAAVAAGRHYPDWSHHWTNAVWKTCSEKWIEGEGTYEGAIVLLGVPFTDRHTWGLGSEDYALWEQVLHRTTSKALDLGLDSSVVLDSVASFVSSFQTPGASPASSLRLVDLLASNIEAPDMRELPVNIIELASETMRAMYPPEPRVRHFAMWVVRSLTTLIEHCPREFSLQLLQTIQDGLCVWLSDRSGEWTDMEFNDEIVVLYQHIVLKVQDLPKSLATLEATAPILNSIFLYRAPAPAIESFMDFWNLIYAKMTPPTEGWTGPIRHCLGVVGILPAEEKTREGTNALSPVSLASAFVISSPRTPVSASFSTPPTAVVRREALARVQSPQRPQKVFGSFPIIPSTPPSPVNHRRMSSSVRRTPLSAIQLCQTPSKRRRLMNEDESGADNKENVMSLPRIPSVAERINELSISNPKKRRFEEDEEEGKAPDADKPAVRSTKKLKAQMKTRSKPVATVRKPSPAPSCSSNESEDERSVAEALIVFPSLDAERSESEESEDFVPRRTRGYGLRALPATSQPVKQLPSSSRGAARSLDQASAPIRKIDLAKMTMRRSVSTPEMHLKPLKTQGKRKRTESDAADNADCDPPALSLVGIRIGPPRHSKPLPIPKSDAPMSSDDDPHYGQVTPHHLISPTLPRRPGSFAGRLAASTRKYAPVVEQELFGDENPGSDDTVGSSGSDSESPTKEFLARQLQRTNSADSICTLASSSTRTA